MRAIVLSTCFLFSALITYVVSGIELPNAVGEAMACINGSCVIDENVACIGGSCAVQTSNSTGTFAFPGNSSLNSSVATDSDSSVSVADEGWEESISDEGWEEE